MCYNILIYRESIGRSMRWKYEDYGRERGQRTKPINP